MVNDDKVLKLKFKGFSKEALISYFNIYQISDKSIADMFENRIITMKMLSNLGKLGLINLTRNTVRKFIKSIKPEISSKEGKISFKVVSTKGDGEADVFIKSFKGICEAEFRETTKRFKDMLVVNLRRIIRKQIKDSFEKKRFGSTKWKSPSKHTKPYKSGESLMVRSGKLRDSILYLGDRIGWGSESESGYIARDGELVFKMTKLESDAPYFIYHQYGAPKGNLPKRQLLGVSNISANKIKAMIRKKTSEFFTGAGGYGHFGELSSETELSF